MLILKQCKTHKMKMGKHYVNNPVGAVLKWPRSPAVIDSDVEVDVVSYTAQEAVLVPIEYARRMFETFIRDEKSKKDMNQMLDILMSDQKSLEGIIEHKNGHRAHYTGA